MHRAIDPTPVGISRVRRMLVNLGLIGLLAGSGFDIATRGEHWPFSSYPMFSRTRQEARLDHVSLIAIPRDGSEGFPLYETGQIHPFYWTRHREAFQRMLDRPGGEADAREAMEDCLERYERGRRAGRRSGRCGSTGRTGRSTPTPRT